MVIVLVALALLAMPALAGDVDETRSTVEFGPDLAVSAGDIELSTPLIVAGVDFNVTIKVYNLGDEDAFGVTVDLLVDTESVDQIELAEVLVDGWAIAPFHATLTQGEHTIGVLVDGNDAINERREDNNDASIIVDVPGLPDASVTASDLSVSSTHPMEGEKLTIEARIHNLGESAATLAVVEFWDGLPGLGDRIVNTTTSIPAGGEKTVIIEWDTTGLGGTHEVFVNIPMVRPSEEEFSNNMASITVLIFTRWDLVIDSTSDDKIIDQEYRQDGFVTVRDGATLTISGTRVEFWQDYENQFALFVEDGGRLVIEDSVVWSDQPMLVIMGNGTSLHMSSQSQLWATILLQGDVMVTIEDSIVDGGLMGSATQLTLKGVQVTGKLDLTDGRLDVEGSLLSSPDTAVRAGATVELRNVTCLGVNTDVSSTAMVYRRIEVLVEDESTLVIPAANIEIEHFINGTIVGTATGGADGKAMLEVLSDIISDGESHFIGNYKVRSTFAGKEGSIPLLLIPFPTMDGEANLPSATVVLPPVDPRTLIASTSGDMVIEAGDEVSITDNFVQDGNIIVRGTLTVASSTLSILQDRNHQYYILVESNGKFELQGATVKSDFPINVYLSGNAGLVMGPGSMLDVTTLVAEDGATVEASATTINARLLLRGGQIIMENGCMVNGDLMVVQSARVEIRGGEILVEEIIIDSDSIAILGIGVTARTMELVGSFANITDSILSVETLSAEAIILTITGSQISASEPLDMAVATLYMDSSTSNQPLASSRTDSKVYLTDAQVPSPFSLGNATVLVYWYLTEVVKDILGNPVSHVDVVVMYTINGTAVASGTTNDDGQVRFPLLGSIVTQEGEFFVGNYKIVANCPKHNDETETRYVNLDRAKTMTTSFPEVLVPPTMVGVEIDVVNTTVVAGTEFVVNGVATAVFKTLTSPLNQGNVEIRLWDNSSTWSNTTTLDADGIFQILIPAPMVDGVYYLQATVIPTGDFSEVLPADSNIITMDTHPPGPTSLVIVLDQSKYTDFPAGGLLTIRGTVKHNTAQGAPAANVRVFLDDPINNQKYQTLADGLGVFVFPPRIGPAFFGQYDYILTARDETLDIETTEPAKMTVIAVEVEEEETKDNSWMLWTVLIIIIAVAAVGSTLAYWAFSSKGRMVECGECGTLVPDNANTCPKCGIEFEVEVAKCSECESWIRSDATTCPYCNTPFRDLEEVGDVDEKPTEEGDEGDVVAVVPDSEESGNGLDDELVIDEDNLRASPEAAKQAPEGLKKEVRPRPVVHRKAVIPKDDDLDPPISNGDDNGNVVRPRVVRKVAAPLPEPEEALSDDSVDEEFDLKEEQEDL
jgi:RNA polymerase subunit RPABC4/transcription elongation factor Spt4